MGQTSLATVLNRHSIVAVDSMVFIYHLEQHKRYLEATRIVFKRIESGKNQAITSMLSLMEVLVLPYRQGQNELALTYRSLLTEYPHLRFCPFDEETAELAAAVRARHNLSTPDAIQAATALRHRATAFITNDKQFDRIKDLDILLLDSF